MHFIATSFIFTPSPGPYSYRNLLEKRGKKLKPFHFSAEKVQREIEAVLEPSHLISYEDRKKLPYTNAVIHEALRYSNITSVGVPRQCVKDTTLLGFHIKKVEYASMFLKALSYFYLVFV